MRLPSRGRARRPRRSTSARTLRPVRSDAALGRVGRHWQSRFELLLRIKSLPETEGYGALSEMLKIVAEFFGFDFGLVSHVRGDDYRLLSCYSKPGLPGLPERANTADTLCSHALRAGSLLALTDLRASDHAAHPAVQAGMVASFIAVPIEFQGEYIGTVAFASQEPRTTPFGTADGDFMRLLGRWVSVRLQTKQAMNELRQSEDRFRILSEATFEAIVMTEGGVVFDANDHAVTLFGFDHHAHIIGRTLNHLVHPDDLDRVTQIIARQAEETYEARLIRHDGTEFLARIQGRPIPYEGRTVRVTAIRDVTTERAREQRLRFQADVLDQVQDAVIATDRFHRIVYWNDGARRLAGKREDEVLGRPINQALAYEWPTEEHEAEARAILLATGQWHGEVFVHTRYGLRCAELTTTKRTGARFEGLIVVARDVTERYTSQQELLRQARQDPLTGQYNRAAFVQRLNERHHRFAHGGTPYGIVYADLDGFKEVNDTHGHAAGDALLHEVGVRLQRVVRRDDMVARLGGDEFAVLLNEPGHRQGMEQALRRIEQALELPMAYGNLQLRLRVSLGSTLVTDAHTDVDAVLREADSKMYQQKRKRKGVAMALPKEVRPPSATKLPDGHRVLYAQPLLTLRTGEVAGFEVLVRWQHPTLGLLGPGAFLPAILGTDEMAEFDAAILEDAIRWGATLPGLPVYVNLSRRGLLDPRMPSRIAAALDEAGLSPHLLVLELTEQMHESPDDFAAVEQLRRIGIGLCLDDFGAGHTSVALAEALPLDQLKVDRRLIGRLGPHSPVERMLEGIVGMAQSRDLIVVAEGIETPDQLQRARMLGFDRAQGFLFSFPVPLDAALELLDGPQMWEDFWTAEPHAH